MLTNLSPSPPSPLEPRDHEGLSTPPLESIDLLYQVLPYEPLPEIGCESPPPSPSNINLPPRPRTPPPGLRRGPFKRPDPVEVGLLKLATVAGCLQDVHQILSQYIITQTPDPTTGRLRLCLFCGSITEAIARNHTAILSYLFFMRVGEPKWYINDAIKAKSAPVFQVFLDYGWDINKPLQRAMAPALG